MRAPMLEIMSETLGREAHSAALTVQGSSSGPRACRPQTKARLAGPHDG